MTVHAHGRREDGAEAGGDARGGEAARQPEQLLEVRLARRDRRRDGVAPAAAVAARRHPHRLPWPEPEFFGVWWQNFRV